MAIMGFNESSLSNSQIYTDYVKSATENPLERAKKLISNSRIIKNDDPDIEPTYIQIKQYTNSLSRSALREFDQGNTVLVYNTDPSIQMVQIIPFLTLRRGDGYKTYIFLQANQRKDGMIQINSGQLHDLLVGAMISTALKRDYSKLTNSIYLERVLMNLYTAFFARILNKEFLIGSEKILYDIIQYFTNRFFLKRIFDSDQDKAAQDDLATKHFRYIDEMKHTEVINTYDAADPNQLSDLLELIKGSSPRVATLKKSTFVNKWLSYYLPAATLAIDNVEYLIFMIVALKNANNLVNHNASDIVKEAKNIKSFDEELLKLI